MILNWILAWWRGNALKDSLGTIDELLIWAVYEITLKKAMAPTPVLFPGESQGWGSLVGCRLWGRTESDTTEVT